MTRPFVHSVPPVEMSLSSIMGLLSEEFSEVCSISYDLQEALSPVLLKLAPTGDDLAKIQMFDLLSQRLEALSVFISALGKSYESEGFFNIETAVSGVTLSDVAGRLSGRPRIVNDQDAGVVDFF